MHLMYAKGNTLEGYQVHIIHIIMLVLYNTSCKEPATTKPSTDDKHQIISYQTLS